MALFWGIEMKPFYSNLFKISFFEDTATLKGHIFDKMAMVCFKFEVVNECALSFLCSKIGRPCLIYSIRARGEM